MLLNVLNPENLSFSDNAYHVVLGVHYSFNQVVIADNEQDALDIVIDHLEVNENKHPAHFLSYSEVENYSDDELEEYLQGGNSGRYLSFFTYELRIEQVENITLYMSID